MKVGAEKFFNSEDFANVVFLHVTIFYVIALNLGCKLLSNTILLFHAFFY